MRSRSNLLWSAIIVLGLSLPGWATQWEVTVRNFSFTPRDLQIAQGDTVIWRNVQGNHNVHHTGNPSLFGISVGSGWTYTFVFSLPAGRYDYVCQPHAPDMAGSVTVSVLETPRQVTSITPDGYSLEQNYPNPFNSQTTIQFSLPREASVKLTVMNVLGEEVREIYTGELTAGTHRVSVDASGLSSGIYFYRLTAGDAILTRRMDFLK